MSLPTRETSTSIATVWPAGTRDEFGRDTKLPPYTIKCTFDYNDGTNYTSSRGISFIPASVIWFEETEVTQLPREGWFIAKGDHTSIPAPTDALRALPIKDVMISDCSLFGEPDDVRVLC